MGGASSAGGCGCVCPIHAHVSASSVTMASSSGVRAMLGIAPSSSIGVIVAKARTGKRLARRRGTPGAAAARDRAEVKSAGA